MQWLVEEALMEKLDWHEQDRHEQAHRDHAVEAAQQRVRANLDAGQQGR